MSYTDASYEVHWIWLGLLEKKVLQQIDYFIVVVVGGGGGCGGGKSPSIVAF